jgi:hypothetical protein
MVLRHSGMRRTGAGPESIAPQQSSEKWIPDSRGACHRAALRGPVGGFRNDKPHVFDEPSHSRAANCFRVILIIALRNRGRRECRALMRARSLACKIKKHASKSPRSRRRHPAFPARLVLTAYSALSPVIGLSCHRRRRNAQHCRQLDASVEASGPRGFVVHDNRIRLVRCRVHRIPRSTFVTIAKRPSCGQETRGNVLVICPSSQANERATRWHDGQIR